MVFGGNFQRPCPQDPKFKFTVLRWHETIATKIIPSNLRRWKMSWYLQWISCRLGRWRCHRHTHWRWYAMIIYTRKRKFMLQLLNRYRIYRPIFPDMVMKLLIINRSEMIPSSLPTPNGWPVLVQILQYTTSRTKLADTR